jgi:hypothetical protein
VSAIFPLTPAQSLGKRTEKSPFFSDVRVFNNSLASSPFAASSLADLDLVVCSGILPLDKQPDF